MCSDHSIFIQAIHDRLIVTLCCDSYEKGHIVRKCVCFDYGPSRKYKDGLDRYHFFDLDSPDGKHNLSILPSQVISVTLTNENFEPSTYVTWTPNWFVKRDWGVYS